MRIQHRLSQIKSPKDLWLLLRIVALAFILPLMLRWMKFPALLKALESRNPAASEDKEQVDKVVRFASFALNGNGFGGKSTCLKKSLLLYHFLGEAGMDVEINLGIKKANDLIGHSWLTSGGEVYLDNKDFTADFEVIYSSGGVK